jgi:hypothetical protein
MQTENKKIINQIFHNFHFYLPGIYQNLKGTKLRTRAMPVWHNMPIDFNKE